MSALFKCFFIVRGALALTGTANPFGPITNPQVHARGSQALLLNTCSSSPSQKWTVNGGNIGVIGPSPNAQNNCLCAPVSGASGPLTLEGCEGGPPLHAFEVGFNFSGGLIAAIPWYPNNKPPSSGLCVTAVAAKAAPQLQPCTAGAANQLWAYDAGSRLATADGALCFEAAAPPPPLVSTVFGSAMVFQRGQSVDIWGSATPGGVVSVTLSGFAPVTATAAANGTWAVSLPPQPAGTGYNITIVDVGSGATQELTDVAFGDVYWCSGQSNMSGGNTPLAYAYNATEEIAASANYPWVRLFTVGTPPGSDTPLSNLANPPHIPWSRAAPGSASRFSATCWFTGKKLADTLGSAVPLGLVESAWGGTSIQVWLPPSSNETCGAPPSYPGGWPTALSACWNSQTTPFAFNGSFSMKVSGIVWYQGESNSLTSEEESVYYVCAMRALVHSLRALFNSPRAYAAIVQLAPWASTAASSNGQVARLRQAQLESSDPPSVGLSTITAVDGGDPHGPIGSIHPRAKKPVGDRAGGALLSNVYARPTPFSGPRFQAAVNGGGGGGASISATLTFSGTSALTLISPSAAGPFANSSVCPQDVDANLCAGFMLQGDSGTWYPASGALTTDGGALVLEVGAAAEKEARVVATASGWSLWPITLLYGDGLMPAFPWNASVGT